MTAPAEAGQGAEDRPDLHPDLTVAAVQSPAVAGDVAANAATAAESVRAAAARGARLVVLPELYLCGYDLSTIGDRPEDCDLDAAALDAEARGRLAPLVEAAVDSGVVALVGASLRHDEGRRTISLLAVGGPGDARPGVRGSARADRVVRAVYDKLHLCGDEAEHFVPGDGPVVLDVDGWPVGLAICYDGCFPEHARAVAAAGALVYVAATAYAVGSEHRRDLYYRARAVENGMYAVVSGLAGDCGSGRFGGGTAVMDAEGRIVESVPDGVSGTVVAALGRADLVATRAAHPMYAEHRAGLGETRFLRLD